MSVVVTIPGPLQELARGRREVRVKGDVRSVSDALSLLWNECPGVRDRVLNERGDVRQHINIFVDGESIRDVAGLSSAVRDGAEIVILPAVSGG